MRKQDSPSRRMISRTSEPLRIGPRAARLLVAAPELAQPLARAAHPPRRPTEPGPWQVQDAPVAPKVAHRGFAGGAEQIRCNAAAKHRCWQVEILLRF